MGGAAYGTACPAPAAPSARLGSDTWPLSSFPDLTASFPALCPQVRHRAGPAAGGADRQSQQEGVDQVCHARQPAPGVARGHGLPGQAAQVGSRRAAGGGTMPPTHPGLPGAWHSRPVPRRRPGVLISCQFLAWPCASRQAWQPCSSCLGALQLASRAAPGSGPPAQHLALATSWRPRPQPARWPAPVPRTLLPTRPPTPSPQVRPPGAADLQRGHGAPLLCCSAGAGARAVGGGGGASIGGGGGVQAAKGRPAVLWRRVCRSEACCGRYALVDEAASATSWWKQCRPLR
jgi:hypothetical protein